MEKKKLDEFEEEIKKSNLSGLIRKLIILEARQMAELNNLPRDGQIQGNRHISYDELTRIVCSRYSPFIGALSKEIDEREKKYDYSFEIAKIMKPEGR